MEKVFFEYNPLGLEIIKDLWSNATFVFDTNVLLNLYRYSDETSKKFLETILELKERVWIPYQVGFEFNKNRLSVISDQKKNYEDFEKKINDIIGEVENKNRNPFLSESLFNKLVSIKIDIKEEIDHKIMMYDQSISLTNDPLLTKINSAFRGKVGSEFSGDELKTLYNDGEKRYKDKVPPGFQDVKKPENERYGDLIIWKQLLSKSKEAKIDIIFILDDGKDDWWLQHQGKTISPRPELLKEFRTQTGKNCHFYKPFQFLEFSNEFLGQKIEVEIIEEVRNYQVDIAKDDSFIQLNLILKGTFVDVNLLIGQMKDAGYNIFSELSEQNDLHEVNVILPKIPDLERRLNSKYLSNLANYNIILISISKK